MAKVLRQKWKTVSRRVPQFLNHYSVLGLLPAMLLIAYWAAGELALLVAAFLVPTELLLISAKKSLGYIVALQKCATQGLMTRDGFEAVAQQNFQKTTESGDGSAIFCLEIDHCETLIDLYGQGATQEMAKTVGSRLASVLRAEDAVAQVNAFGFSVCLEPTQNLDLELCIQLASRLQTAVEEPLVLDGATVCVTACIGFAQQSRAAMPSARSWCEAASIALRQAQRHGSGSIRAFTQKMRQQSVESSELRAEVDAALNKGQIKPWYQPKISTDTGRVSGFEALARWEHPKKGLIPPADFLPVIEEAGLLEKLAEMMMTHAFTALKTWDEAKLEIPQVGVNFAGPELNNPNLVEKTKR